MLVNRGKEIIVDRILGSGTEPKYSAIGTGTTAAAAADTALQSEVESRVNGTSSKQTTTTTSDTYRVVATHSITATRAITEAGLLDAASTGNLFVRAVFSAINLINGDSLQLTFNTVFADGG